jgi:xanthine dehydrogenase molybdenum-binding subunit
MGTVATVPPLVPAAQELKRRALAAAVAPRMTFSGIPGIPLFPGKKIEDLDIKDSMIYEKAGPTLYIMGRQAHFIEVEVDMETGMVLTTNIVCVNDVGHIFNRQGAEAQQYGGAIMGSTKNTMEEKVYCPRTGVGLNFNMLDYRLGTMNDYPPVQCILNESHLGYSAYGAYGIG